MAAVISISCGDGYPKNKGIAIDSFCQSPTTTHYSLLFFFFYLFKEDVYIWAEVINMVSDVLISILQRHHAAVFPPEYQFELAVFIILSRCFAEKELRQACLRIRLMAASTLGKKGLRC